MKGNIKNILLQILAIVLVFSGAIGVIITFFAEVAAQMIEFFTWLFLLEYTQSEISLVGEIVVRVLTFAITFVLMKFIFGRKGSGIKETVRWIISTIISFGLSCVVMLLEQHIVTILIVLAIVAVVVLAVWLTVYFVKKKKEKAKLEVSN